MKKVYLEAELISSTDRMDDCKVAIQTTSGKKTEVECSAYKIFKEKPDTETILRMLNLECDNMIAKAGDNYNEKAIIAQVFGIFTETIKKYQ